MRKFIAAAVILFFGIGLRLLNTWSLLDGLLAKLRGKGSAGNFMADILLSPFTVLILVVVAIGMIWKESRKKKSGDDDSAEKGGEVKTSQQQLTQQAVNSANNESRSEVKVIINNNAGSSELWERTRVAESAAHSAGMAASVADSKAESVATRIEASPVGVDRVTERKNRIQGWRDSLVGSRRKSRGSDSRSFTQIFVQQPAYKSLKGHLSETTIEALNTGRVDERLVSDDELEDMITDDIFLKEKEWDLH